MSGFCTFTTYVLDSDSDPDSRLSIRITGFIFKMYFWRTTGAGSCSVEGAPAVPASRPAGQGRQTVRKISNVPKQLRYDLCRAVDPHSFFSDPDPAVSFNADSNPAGFLMRIQIQLIYSSSNYLVKSFLPLIKTKLKDCSKLVKIYYTNFI